MQTIVSLAMLILVATSSIAFGAAEEHPHAHDQAAHLKLKLNNGQKWVSDQHTFDSVESMKSTIERIQEDHSPPTISELQETGIELQQQLSNLIRGCRMSGPDHDQLHIWISLLAPEIKTLIDLSDETSGHAAATNISKLIEDFDKHFQVDTSNQAKPGS